MSARENILARLRAAPRGAALPPPDVGAHYAKRSRREDQGARVLRLKTALEAAHAEVVVTDLVSWPQQLVQLARAKSVRRLLVGTGGFAAHQLASHAPTEVELVSYDRIAGARRSEWFDAIDASLTLARAAIAETGSLILWPDATEPRLMSLVPPIHFALLEASKIHADLYSAMRDERWETGLPSNALLISGPSKTADIQLTLAYGAHGPRELIVLIVPSFASAA
jgi:L-lactate dehydrogenase complex protein LldG